MNTSRFGTAVYVLCWVPGTQGMTWCKTIVVKEWGNRYALEFVDGSGVGVFPKDEVYDQPDFKLSKQVQEI